MVQQLADRRFRRATILTSNLLIDMNMDRDKWVTLAKEFAVEKPQRFPSIIAARTPMPLAMVDDKKWKRTTKHIAQRQKPTQAAPKRQPKVNVPSKKTKYVVLKH